MHPNVRRVLVSTLSVEAAGYYRYVVDRADNFNAQAHFNIWSSTRIPSVDKYGEVVSGIYGVIAAIILGVETIEVEQLRDQSE